MNVMSAGDAAAASPPPPLRREDALASIFSEAFKVEDAAGREEGEDDKLWVHARRGLHRLCCLSAFPVMEATSGDVGGKEDRLRHARRRGLLQLRRPLHLLVSAPDGRMTVHLGRKAGARLRIICLSLLCPGAWLDQAPNRRQSHANLLPCEPA